MQNTQLRQIKWEQFTPLLVKAEKVFFKKSKITQKGEVIEDTKNWVLESINWQFSPLHEPQGIMKITTINKDLTPITDDTASSETFDFLNGAFKFYYNEASNEIFAEIDAVEAGLTATYRYVLSFYGKQVVDNKDLLVNQGICAKKNNTSVNSIIAL